ncbi:MAG: hypothetical protein CM1200mP29_11790 [Verrucomicrobiota bacterium]|nr:MAG: hypothetical protein CM1200mP29_11790 [Verrucomicrobiota bacterium]
MVWIKRGRGKGKRNKSRFESLRVNPWPCSTWNISLKGKRAMIGLSLSRSHLAKRFSGA